MDESSEREYTIELFVRAEPEFGTEAARQAVVDRLGELKRTGPVAKYDVHAWGKSIRLDGPLQGTSYHGHVVEHVESFRNWAATNGVSLGGAFANHDLHSAMTDEAFTTVSLPTCCLAVYVDEDLVAVYPHVAAGRQHGVFDALEGLTADRPAPPPGTSP
jgi:hypothetical protein